MDIHVYSKKDGTVQFSCANTQNNAISIDLGGKRIIYEIKSLNIGDALGAGIASDGAYYSISNTGISKYNEETSAFDMIIPSDSFNANMNEFYKMSVLCASDNTFFLANTNGIDPREGLIVYRLTRADINPNAGKRRLSVGLYGEYIIPPTLASALYEFNKKSDSCFASIKMYDYTLTYFEDEDSKEKARQEKANELMRDILDGKGPDVIINAFDIQQAGCLGYTLYNQLTSAGVKCVILAPTTMLTQQGKRIKTDKRDALMIAQCLSYGGYQPVYIPTEEDDSVKEYLRMRDDHKIALKKIKQQINAFCLRHGYHYPQGKWTQMHRFLKPMEYLYCLGLP